MEYPGFFDDIEIIVLKDELTKFLGVNKDGMIEITYLDIVKMAGHSCPTVGGAYLMALKGLKALYPDEIPQRGEIKVELKNRPPKTMLVSTEAFFLISQVQPPIMVLAGLSRVNIVEETSCFTMRQSILTFALRVWTPTNRSA